MEDILNLHLQRLWTLQIWRIFYIDISRYERYTQSLPEATPVSPDMEDIQNLHLQRLWTLQIWRIFQISISRFAGYTQSPSPETLDTPDMEDIPNLHLQIWRIYSISIS